MASVSTEKHDFNKKQSKTESPKKNSRQEKSPKKSNKKQKKTTKL
jgi:hypothetical protein